MMFLTAIPFVGVIVEGFFFAVGMGMGVAMCVDIAMHQFTVPVLVGVGV